MPTSSLTERVKEKARQLGFALVGVTGPEQPPHLDIYRNWLNQGRHGEMSYLGTERARKRRANPREILPECKSILVLAVPYNNPTSNPHPTEVKLGRVAAYAWGEDYHEILKGRLQAMVQFIEEESRQPVPNRWYTDSGPLLERELAQRAGLGWIGKNTMLINPERGSYFLLAEILLGIELDLDQPISTDHCGSCTRCIEACPTGCILPDRTLDATRCISYLTIELKGSVPTKLRNQIGEWAFGCDICQIACPWNERFALEHGDPAFESRRETNWVNLENELTLSPEGFNRKFKNSPIRRARRRGYLRNVSVALGNAKSVRSVAVLANTLMSEPEALVRGHAAWAISRIGGSAARIALESAARKEKDNSVREEIEFGLEVISG